MRTCSDAIPKVGTFHICEVVEHEGYCGGAVEVDDLDRVARTGSSNEEP
jgi:hypothetical protein